MCGVVDSPLKFPPFSAMARIKAHASWPRTFPTFFPRVVVSNNSIFGKSKQLFLHTSQLALS